MVKPKKWRKMVKMVNMEITLAWKSLKVSGEFQSKGFQSVYFPCRKGKHRFQVLKTISTSCKQQLPFKDPPKTAKGFILHHVFFKGPKDAATLTPISWPRIVVVTRTSSPEPVPTRPALGTKANVSRYDGRRFFNAQTSKKYRPRERILKDVICNTFVKSLWIRIIFPVGPVPIHNNIITFLSDNLGGIDNSAWKGICC